MDADDFLGSVIVSRPLVSGAGGDFRLPGLGLLVDGSKGYTMWVATDQVRVPPPSLTSCCMRGVYSGILLRSLPAGRTSRR